MFYEHTRDSFIVMVESYKNAVFKKSSVVNARIYVTSRVKICRQSIPCKVLQGTTKKFSDVVDFMMALVGPGGRVVGGFSLYRLKQAGSAPKWCLFQASGKLKGGEYLKG